MTDFLKIAIYPADLGYYYIKARQPADRFLEIPVKKTGESRDGGKWYLIDVAGGSLIITDTQLRSIKINEFSEFSAQVNRFVALIRKLSAMSKDALVPVKRVQRHDRGLARWDEGIICVPKYLPLQDCTGHYRSAFIEASVKLAVRLNQSDQQYLPRWVLLREAKFRNNYPDEDANPEFHWVARLGVWPGIEATIAQWLEQLGLSADDQRYS